MTERVIPQPLESGILQTKHTQKGHDLFVVQIAQRVEREDYLKLNVSAKRLGGYYSSYRGNGAVPGFTFTDRKHAEAFSELAGGKPGSTPENDAFPDNQGQSGIERLKEMAARLNERAHESLGRERKANTARRARFAASAEMSDSSHRLRPAH